MNEVYLAVIPDCDICKRAGRVSPAAYDGKTTFGPHAYMCESCFARHGLGPGPLGRRIIAGERPRLTGDDLRVAVLAALDAGDHALAEDLVGDGDLLEWL